LYRAERNVGLGAGYGAKEVEEGDADCTISSDWTPLVSGGRPTGYIAGGCIEFRSDCDVA
jgi:hypothetical protein